MCRLFLILATAITTAKRPQNDRNYDRYDRNYDRYDRNYDRYDRNYDRNYDRLDRYDRLRPLCLKLQSFKN